MSKSPLYGTRYYDVDPTPALVAVPAGNTIAGFFASRSLARVGWILGISGLSLATYYGIKYLLYGGQAGAEAENNGPQDKPKVVLHHCPRGFTLPCILPFPLKVETFLRVAGIPYEVDLTSSMEPESRSPFMTIGENLVFDVRECVPMLSKLFEINLEEGARPSRLTASHMVELMLENRINWAIAIWRWVFDKGASIPSIQPIGDEGVIAQAVDDFGRAAKHHKLGRQPFEEVVEIVGKDLADLSAALGKHYYFLGNSPGEPDCTAFAMFAQILWAMPNCPFFQEIQKYPNLCEFTIRMREEFWKDWEEVLAQPGNEESTRFFFPVNELTHPIVRGQVTDDELVDSDWEELDANVSRKISRSTPASLPSRSSVPSKANSNSRVQFDSRARSKDSISNIENNNMTAENFKRDFESQHDIHGVQGILDSLKQKVAGYRNESNEDDSPILDSTHTQTNLHFAARPRTRQNFQKLNNLQEALDEMTQVLQLKPEQKKDLNKMDMVKDQAPLKQSAQPAWNPQTGNLMTHGQGSASAPPGTQSPVQEFHAQHFPHSEILRGQSQPGQYQGGLSFLPPAQPQYNLRFTQSGIPQQPIMYPAQYYQGVPSRSRQAFPPPGMYYHPNAHPAGSMSRPDFGMMVGGPMVYGQGQAFMTPQPPLQGQQQGQQQGGAYYNGMLPTYQSAAEVPMHQHQAYAPPPPQQYIGRK